MKRGTPDHPKVHSLAAALKIEKWGAVGILECLWHFTAQYALDGGIGRYSDEAIARAIGWNGASAMLALGKHDPSTVLVSCLNAAGWIDACSCHRFRVHDWPEHADQTVQRVLSKRGQAFIQCYDDPSTVLAPSKMPLPLPLPKANTNTSSADADVIERIFQAYPKKVGKGAALKAIKKAIKLVQPQDLLDAVQEFAASPLVKSTDPKYLPYPATWFNARRWEDDRSEWNADKPKDWRRDTSTMTDQDWANIGIGQKNGEND